MIVKEPETILIFAANPADQPPLRLDTEVREIENGLRHSRKHFTVKQQWATRPKDLRRALLDYNPSYVHFCGHGAGTAGIVLEGQLVHADALAGLFKLFSDRIKCVVLNACYSSVQARAIVQHIDFVVGMNKAIGDSAAIEFSTAFYDAIGAGEAIDFGFALGCNAIQLAGIPEHLTPELLTRSGLAPEEPVTSSTTDHTRVRHDWDGAPDVSNLYGRAADAELLKSWILEDSCRVVLITGLGGIGKTDLATCLGRGGNRSKDTCPTLAEGIQKNFDCVMWRSLLNAPPPEDLFADMIGFLSEHRRSARHSANLQIDDVLNCLQDRHCLVILDNVESILNPADPSMRYREGYAAYGAFFEQVAKMNHQSCLLMTSREKPRAIADLEGSRKPVRSLALTGIGTNESQSLFAQIGIFSGSQTEWDHIVKFYNGNPLALELAARHIDQVFGGQLAPFLTAGRPVFGHLEELLNWHLERLSPEEAEVVDWLAIEREPVTLATLYDDLVSSLSRKMLTSTLQSLQRRIPLERAIKGCFALQPVLIEHVTARLVNRVISAFTRTTPRGVQDDIVDSPRPAHNPVDALQLLDKYALLKATSKESVRDSQRRLIVGPVAEGLAPIAVRRELSGVFVHLLDVWRREGPGDVGYAAGNILNLLSYLNVDLSGFNFSHLPIWQGCLHEVSLRATDFSFSVFRQTTFREPFGAVFSLSYSPNGELIAVGDDNGEVRLFLAANGQFQLRCLGHSDVVWSVAFSPDGQTLASASFDNTIRLWNVKDGRCIDVLLGHEGWVYSAAFSPDGKSLASASEDGTCRVWDLQLGTSVIAGLRDSGFVAAVAFSPDGQMLAMGGSSGVIAVYRISDLVHPILLLEHKARIRAIAFSRKGGMLASGGEDRCVKLWKRDGEHLKTLDGHSDSLTSLSFSASDDVLASASVDHTVRLWSMPHMECNGQLHAASARVWTVACSPTERMLATGSEDGGVRIWDLDTRECLTTLRGYSNKTLALAFSPNSPLLFAGNDDSIVRGWDTNDGRSALEFRGHTSRVWATTCSDDGRWVATASDDLTVRLWDAHSGSCLRVMRGHTDWIRSVAFDGDSRLLASAGEDGKIIVWDVATGSRLLAIAGAMTRIFSVAFCQAGTLLAAGGSDHSVHLFSTFNGSHLGELRGHGGRVNAVVPREADDTGLATCSEDGTIRFWDLARQECTEVFVVGCKVWCGAFCDQSESFLSGSEDGTLRRWAIGSKLCEAALTAHQGPVWTLAVSATEETVATAGNDGSIRLWNLPDLTPSLTPNILRPPRPYEGMNISGAIGLTQSRVEALMALGAIVIPGTSIPK